MCISGFGPEDKLEKNKDVFDEIIDLLSAIKLKLIQKTKLTVTTSKDVKQAPPPSTGISTKIQPARNDAQNNKKIKEIETALLARLPRDKFDNIMKLLNSREDNNVYRLHYTLSKDLPQSQPIEVEYLALNPQHNLDTKAGRRKPVRINVTGKGVTILTTDALALVMQRTKDIVAQVPGLTMERALEDCILVYCFDGAVHENTSQINKQVITYSLTLGSYNLAKLCGVFPTSGNNILPFAQLHAS